MAVDPVTAGLNFGSKFIDKIFPDKNEAQKAKLALVELQQKGELAELVESSHIIQEETKSEHFIVSAWRPITMLVFVFIIANNYILFPYFSLFFDEAPKLDIPPDMWDLLKIGLGGYVAGRSIEKTAAHYAKGKD